MKKELVELEKLIAAFKNIAKDYPNGGYDNTVAKLETERAELVAKIGKK